jgi:outer membrane protein TolC
MNKWIALFAAALLLINNKTQAQQTTKTKDSILQSASLETCLQYALQHKPLLQQSLLDEQSTDLAIKGKLADWYPQVNFDYSLQNTFQLPTAYSSGTYFQSGTFNTSGAFFSVNQTIFNKDVLIAKRSKLDVQKQAEQNLENNRIYVKVSVSKAFYDVLLTQKQIDLTNATIKRLETSLKNAYDQYKDGIVDKTDYKRASIALNNTKAQLKAQQEALKAKVAYLKNVMGYTADNSFDLQYDTLQMEKEMVLDTMQSIKYSNRIEYKQLETTKRLQQYNLAYSKMSYYPSVSAYGAYDMNFLNNDFGKLYNQNYPNSFVGLKLSLPLYQGNKRVYQTKSAEIAIKRIDWDLLQLRSNISTQYVQALAAYKANLYDYILLKDNLQLAQEVYNTIQLQYKAGIKNYLEVITAETDLRSSQENNTNALYQVLASKIDVEQALGVYN